ncbi:SAM-dependent methyltransferase [Nitratiruptor sp. YY09-18]|uniref:SAM-dependent methyltransferase n=1 Tax=Nitratiruptor sp. YY09-18 TaxID=2724901 RepID=UPI00193663BB|nr:SAM-dependent methyltransferase [Nitratiruptor sp. YY09-18]BCD68267.1 hypothetical protein NitYY0918_C1178 [Nitratiruptor sp. YY09-18]
MIPFSQFFYQWLYGEGGYYTKPLEIGKSGDFFTAVSVSPLFGGAIANHIYKQIQNGVLSHDATIFEVGAHRGYLLADIVQFLYTFDPSLIKRLTFAIVEPFTHLQKIQQEYFKQSFGNTVKLEHYISLKNVKKKQGFVVANEIFDAFPCELYYKGKMGYVKEFQVVWDECEEDIASIAHKYGIQKGEISRGFGSFAKQLAQAFEKVEFVAFDYGDLEHRNEFSLRIYYEHQVHPFFEEGLDISKYYKKSDITYDVHFAYLIDSFEEAGFEKVAYKTQLAALVDFGITELLEKIMQSKGFEVYKRELEKVKILIAPNQMGERFKMVNIIKQ